MYDIIKSKKKTKTPKSVKQQTSSNLQAYVILAILSIVWGSSFILIKKSLVSFSGLQVGAGRIVFAFLAFTPLFIYQFKKLEWKYIKPIAVVGICGSGLPAILYAVAQVHIPSGVAGLLNGLTPIFTFLLAITVFGKSFKWQQMIGISLGLIGTSLIFFHKNEVTGSFPILYGLLIILATFCYGVSANTVGKYLGELKPIMISTLSFMILGPWAMIYLLSTDFIHVVSSHPDAMTSFGSLLVLSLVGTFGANILFFKLIQITEPVFSSSVSFITPIVALFWGFMDGEFLSIFYVFALMLILSGVFLIKSHKAKSG